jgi:hypothetical protein
MVFFNSATSAPKIAVAVMPFFVEIQSWTQKKAQISKIFGRNPPK